MNNKHHCSTSTPEFFQKISKILRGCEGVVCLIDNVLVHGRTEEEHHECLMAVLQRLRNEGVMLNKNKSIFYTNIHFLGQKVDSDEVSPVMKRRSELYKRYLDQPTSQRSVDF